MLARAEQAAREREKTQAQIAMQMHRINYLNRKKTDRFVELLLEHRPDLAGLPFVMGDACRMKTEEGSKFSAAVTMVHKSLKAHGNQPKAFWKLWSETRQPVAPIRTENITVDGKACVAALMQVLPKEPARIRLGLVEHLSTFNDSQADRDEATRALARLAIYSPEEQIRRAANSALLKRETGPSTDQLVKGLRYPWASVAESTAEALVQQQRTDLVPQLVGMLDEADPRAPVLQETEGRKVLVVREVVRINHMRNCLLCHPPAQNAKLGQQTFRVGSIPNVLAPEVATGPVPPPGHGLETDPEEGGYGSRQNPDILIRADVTYLRQDFSLMQKVADSAPWPEMQRFDFLVRTRVVSEQEANFIRAELGRQPSPYRQAALQALRRLTGRDAGETAQAWRTALARN